MYDHRVIYFFLKPNDKPLVRQETLLLSGDDVFIMRQLAPWQFSTFSASQAAPSVFERCYTNNLSHECERSQTNSFINKHMYTLSALSCTIYISTVLRSSTKSNYTLSGSTHSYTQDKGATESGGDIKDIIFRGWTTHLTRRTSLSLSFYLSICIDTVAWDVGRFYRRDSHLPIPHVLCDRETAHSAGD